MASTKNWRGHLKPEEKKKLAKIYPQLNGNEIDEIVVDIEVAAQVYFVETFLKPSRRKFPRDEAIILLKRWIEVLSEIRPSLVKVDHSEADSLMKIWKEDRETIKLAISLERQLRLRLKTIEDYRAGKSRSTKASKVRASDILVEGVVSLSRSLFFRYGIRPVTTKHGKFWQLLDIWGGLIRPNGMRGSLNKEWGRAINAGLEHLDSKIEPKR